MHKIINGALLTCMGFAFFSCAEDSYHDIGGTTSQRVIFKAVNLDVTDMDEAESTISKEYHWTWELDKQISLKVFNLFSCNGIDMKSEEVVINLGNQSQIWSGGYNDIEVTFIPTSPEEKEATFTMPDGSTFIATSEKPTFIWTPDSTMRLSYSYSVAFIKAQSRYVKGNTLYENEGYIFVQINPNIRYNKYDDKWYYSEWFYDKTLTAASYVKFKVENLTIGSPDQCISCNNLFPETEISRNETIYIPYELEQGSKRVYEETLTGNDFMVCGNNDIRLSFIPENGQDELHLYLPDKSDIILTVENPSYIWHLTREQVRDIGYRTYIYGYSSYIKNGIIFDCSSYVLMNSMYEMWFDTESDVFRYGQWWW